MAGNKSEFWVSNLNELNLLEFWPRVQFSVESNMNRVTVLVLYISVISSIIAKTFTPLYFGVLTVAGIAVFYYFKYPQPEGMENIVEYRKPVVPSLSNPLRAPTPNNPFMNVQITDYDKPQEYKNYNRYKEAIYPTPETENIRKGVKDDFVASLFQDPNGRLFERNNSQRQFISQPVGSVPSRQNEFAQWLYGKEFVCKSASIWDRYGLETTPDSMVCTGFDASSPTNNGIKEKF